MTLDNQLWIGGVVCSLLYIATVVMLRDPLFMYAVEGGVTLTVILLLGSMGYISNVTYLSLALMGLAFISIHFERAFPVEEKTFSRRRFGMPLFWSGHAQLIAALAILLGSQLGAFAFSPVHHRDLFGWGSWDGNLLSQKMWLATALWFAGVYAYVYSGYVVRLKRADVYLYMAAFCFLCGELTIIGNSKVPDEVMIAAPALTALLISLMGFL